MNIHFKVNFNTRKLVPNFKTKHSRRGSRGTVQQYVGEHTLLYKEVTMITSHSFNNFAVRQDPRML